MPLTWKISARVKRLALFVSPMVAFWPASASAQDHETWRCTAPNGHYDQNPIPISDKSTTISGRILFHKGFFAPAWNSLAKINIAQGGGGDCHCSGVTAIAFPEPGGVDYYMDGNGSQTLNSKRLFDVPITFVISIDQNGIMTTQIGSKTPVKTSVRLFHPEHNYLMLICSGADVSFLNINVR